MISGIVFWGCTVVDYLNSPIITDYGIMASRVQVRGGRLQFQERTQLSHVVVYSTSTHHQKALDSLIFQRWHLSWCLPRVRPLSFILRFIRFVFVLLNLFTLNLPLCMKCALYFPAVFSQGLTLTFSEHFILAVAFYLPLQLRLPRGPLQQQWSLRTIKK